MEPSTFGNNGTQDTSIKEAGESDVDDDICDVQDHSHDSAENFDGDYSGLNEGQYDSDGVEGNTDQIMQIQYKGTVTIYGRVVTRITRLWHYRTYCKTKTSRH